MIVPARFEKVFFDWMENIRDWNVSRQLWWGHRIPAWYCPDGHVTVSDEADGPRVRGLRPPGARAAPGRGHLRHLVLVGLWPFSTLGWPDDTTTCGASTRLGDGDRLRHHLLLGRPDDDARRVADRAASRSTPSTSRHGPRPVRRQDVQDEGQCRRSAGGDRGDGRRRPALRARSTGPSRATTRRWASRGSRVRATSPTSCGTPPASCSAPPERAGRRRGAGAAARTNMIGPAEHWILEHAATQTIAPSTPPTPASSWARRTACCTTPSGASTATGTSRSPR
jgi:hypothetical protein